MHPPERGVALRFPRFIRVRDDKAPGDATSASALAGMYLAQRQGQGGGQAAAPADDSDDDLL